MPRRVPPAVFVNHWVSMVGALAGVLRALGSTLSAAEIDALSGHAFRFAVAPAVTDEGEMDAGGPDRFATETALPLYASLGWSFVAIEMPAGDPRYDATRTMILNAARSATHAGHPVILYGLHVPRFGIVRAVEGEALVASTAVSAQVGERLPLSQWPPPGPPLPLRAFLPERRGRETRALAELLRFAVTYARNGDSPGAVGVAGAATGFAAYERWITLLESDAAISPGGHAYCLHALQQARAEAAAFLRNAATGTPIAPPLAAAAAAYEAETLALAQLITLFPYPNGGDIGSPGARRIAALYARRAYAAERDAIAHLATALGS